MTPLMSLRRPIPRCMIEHRHHNDLTPYHLPHPNRSRDASFSFSSYPFCAFGVSCGDSPPAIPRGRVPWVTSPLCFLNPRRAGVPLRLKGLTYL
jgi:hypothetical protein